MANLIGKIQYKVFAQGTKSESKRPFICFENGTQILLYKKDDNPFENKTVEVEGDLVNGVFEVTSVKEYVAEEKKSGGEE